LWPFVKSPAIFKCPSDRSTVKNSFQGGAVVPRILTMSMNLFVGGFAPDKGMGTGGTDGNWPWAHPYRIFTKLSDVNNASKIFLFLDMREDSVNWSNFMQNMSGYSPLSPNQWTLGDMPGMYHNRAAGFSFVDGHSEIKKWLDGRTAPPLAATGTTLDQAGFDFAAAGKNNQDVFWLQDRSTVAK